MSDLITQVTDAALPSLQRYVEELPQQYLDKTTETLEGLDGPVRAKVEGHFKKAAEYKLKAIQQSDETVRRQYVEGAADEVARALTVIKSEATAISNEVAEQIAAGFLGALEVLGGVAKTALTAIVSGLASGAVKGLTGGGGLDLGSVFPGA